MQFTDCINVKKKEAQSVDTSVLLSRGNKILMGGERETKCGAETERKAIQRLSYLRIHPINSHQTPTLLWMTRSACQKEPVMVVSEGALPEPYIYRGRC